MNDQSSITPTNESPKPKRRWLQFSLRTLLVMMLLFGCGLGWVASERRTNAKCRDQIDALRKLGLGVHIIERESGRPAWLQAIFGDDSWRHVVWVNLEQTRDAGSGLKHITDFTELQELWTSRNVTDADLVHLKGLTELRTLKLAGTNISDAGLVHLKPLTQLHWLQLYNTNVTDAGLEHLKALKNLRRLSLHRNQITSEGIANFQKSNPNCEVN